MKILPLATVASLMISSGALAQEAPPPLTIQKCLEILGGLNALNFAGEQIGNQNPAPANASQYKFGATRMTIALDIAALTKIQTAVRETAQAIQRETEAEIPIPENSKDSTALSAKRNERENAELQKALDKPCNVQIARLNAADLKLTDNEIPVGVLAVLAPIIDLSPPSAAQKEIPGSVHH